MEALGGAFGMGEVRERVGDVEASCETLQERIKEAIAGMCCGVLLVLASFIMLGWNEKRTVQTAETIDLARDDYVQLDNCIPEPANDGKLVALGPCSGVPEDTGNGNGVFTDAQLLNDIIGPGANFRLTAEGSTPLLASWSREVSVYAYGMKSDTCSQKVEKCTSKSGGSSGANKSCSTETEHNSYKYYQLGWFSAPVSSSSDFSEQDCSNTPNQRIDVVCDSPPVFAGIPLCTQPSNPIGWTSTSSKTSIICIGDNIEAASTLSCGRQPGQVWILGDNGAIDDLLDSSSTLILEGGVGISTDSQMLTADKFGFVCPHNSPEAVYIDAIRFNRMFQDNDTMTLTKACTTGATGTALVPAGNQNDADHKIAWRKSHFSSQGASIMGKQTKNKDGHWEMGEWVNPHNSDCTGCKIFKWQKGAKTGAQFLEDLEDMNTAVKWALRIFGWLFMWCGMQLCVAPLAMVPGMIPPEELGDCLEGVAGKILSVLTCCMATGCSLFVIAVAWVAFRPMVAIPLLILCCCMMAATAGASFLKYQDMKKTKIAAAHAKTYHADDEGAGPGPDYHAAGAEPPTRTTPPPTPPPSAPDL